MPRVQWTDFRNFLTNRQTMLGCWCWALKILEYLVLNWFKYSVKSYPEIRPFFASASSPFFWDLAWKRGRSIYVLSSSRLERKTLTNAQSGTCKNFRKFSNFEKVKKNIFFSRFLQRSDKRFSRNKWTKIDENQLFAGIYFIISLALYEISSRQKPKITAGQWL